MILIQSKLEGLQFGLYYLEQQLKPLGLVVGGGWQYDHGYFDYQISNNGSYQFLRIPFETINGSLDAVGTFVQLGRPILLFHEYKKGNDDHASVGVLSGAFNQFAEPTEKNGEVSDLAVEVGKKLVREIEKILC